MDRNNFIIRYGKAVRTVSIVFVVLSLALLFSSASAINGRFFASVVTTIALFIAAIYITRWQLHVTNTTIEERTLFSRRTFLICDIAEASENFSSIVSSTQRSGTHQATVHSVNIYGHNGKLFSVYEHYTNYYLFLGWLRENGFLEKLEKTED